MRRGYGKKVPETRVKPLHERGFAGMLPRTMSQGNDAFTSKDAASSNSDQDDSASTESHSDQESSRTAEPSQRNASEADASGASERARADDTTSKKSRSDDDSDERDREEDDERELSRDAKDRTGSTRRGSSKSRRPRRDDDDDDDERLVPPQTEEALDVPKKHTIYMLGAMSALTVVLWFMAKLSCNIHPDQMRDPKHFSTRELAADPKNAAFEFHHRFETADYVTSFDLATGEMKRIVETKLSECEQGIDACLERQKRMAGTIESTARVMDRGENRATVEITSVYKGSLGTKDFSFEVVKEGEFWRVASRRELATAPVQQVPTTEATATPPAAAAPVEMSDQPATPAP